MYNIDIFKYMGFQEPELQHPGRKTTTREGRARAGRSAGKLASMLACKNKETQQNNIQIKHTRNKRYGFNCGSLALLCTERSSAKVPPVLIIAVPPGASGSYQYAARHPRATRVRPATSV